MPLADEDEQAIDETLLAWRQGDVSLDAGLEFLHLADLSRPHSPASLQVADAVADGGEALEGGPTPVLDEVRGVVILSQTCDVVRGCRERPFVEVAPLIEMSGQEVEAIRRLRRPAFAHVSATAEAGLVADLDRTMTVEKALVARWSRTPGWEIDEELRDFAVALARKRSRFAFPDDFVSAAQRLQRYLADKHDKKTKEGSHLRMLREIRVRAAPSWDSELVTRRNRSSPQLVVRQGIGPGGRGRRLAQDPGPVAHPVRPDRPIPARFRDRLPVGRHDGPRLRGERSPRS